jgi:flavodoxin
VCHVSSLASVRPIHERWYMMKIGMVVYSKTGHTQSVAAALQSRLAAGGHEVALLQLGQTAVDLTPYDGLIFCSPVHGGQPAAEMIACLEGAPSLQDKTVACLVTGFFPANLGRNQALAQMQARCEARGGAVAGQASVGWFSLTRRPQIADAVETLAARF